MHHVIAGRRPATLGISLSKLLMRVREAQDMHTHTTIFSSVAEYPVRFIAKGMHNAGNVTVSLSRDFLGSKQSTLICVSL